MLIVRARGSAGRPRRAALGRRPGSGRRSCTSAPPPTWRQSPVTPGIAMIARSAEPPPAWRCMPRPTRMPVGRVAASRSPSATIRSTGSPVIAAARSSGHSSRRASSSGQPTRVRRELVAVRGARVEDDVHQAERQRGVGAGQRREVLVARSAVRVRSGSIATTCAPACSRLAARTSSWWMAVDERVRAPQQDQLRVGERLRVDADLAAVVAAAAARAGGRADRRVEPRRAEHVQQPLAGTPEPWTSPSVPGAEERQIASRPCRSIAGCSPRRSRSSASSHEIRSKRPSPFAPDPPQRVQQPVGRLQRASR